MVADQLRVELSWRADRLMAIQSPAVRGIGARASSASWRTAVADDPARRSRTMSPDRSATGMNSAGLIAPQLADGPTAAAPRTRPARRVATATTGW